MRIKDYANDKAVMARVEPILSEHKFDAVPVRIILDQQGKVKHIPFLSAFPDQAQAVTDALRQWKSGHKWGTDGRPKWKPGLWLGVRPFQRGVPQPILNKARGRVASPRQNGSPGSIGRSLHSPHGSSSSYTLPSD